VYKYFKGLNVSILLMFIIFQIWYFPTKAHSFTNTNIPFNEIWKCNLQFDKTVSDSGNIVFKPCACALLFVELMHSSQAPYCGVQANKRIAFKARSHRSLYHHFLSCEFWLILLVVRYCSESSRHRYRKMMKIRNPNLTNQTNLTSYSTRTTKVIGNHTLLKHMC